MGGLLRQVASTLAAPAAAFLAGPILARVLGPDGRGELAAATSAVILIITMCAAGLPDTAALSAAKGQGSVTGFLARHWMAVVFLSISCTAICMLAGYLVFGDSLSAQMILILGAFTSPILLLAEIARGSRVGSGALIRVQIESYTNNFGRLALLSGLAVAGVLSTFSAGAVTLACMAGGAIALIMRRAPTHLSIPSIELGREENAVARGIWPGNVATQAKLRLDQVLMVILTSSSQIGFYAVAVSVSQIFSLGVFGVRSFLFRGIASAETGHDVARIVRILPPVLVLIMVPALVAANPLVVLIFGSAFEPAALMCQILLAGVIPQAVGGILGVALNASGRAVQHSAGQWIGLSVSTLLLVLIAPAWGGVGASLASALGYFVSGLWSLIWFERTFRVGWRVLLIPTRQDLRWIVSKFQR